MKPLRNTTKVIAALALVSIGLALGCGSDHASASPYVDQDGNAVQADDPVAPEDLDGQFITLMQWHRRADARAWDHGRYTQPEDYAATAPDGYRFTVEPSAPTERVPADTIALVPIAVTTAEGDGVRWWLMGHRHQQPGSTRPATGLVLVGSASAMEVTP